MCLNFRKLIYNRKECKFISKVYILAICLLAASFTGCLTDDTSDSIEQEENTEEETIEPVGMNNNETDDYDELVSEIQNLTDEIEELNNQIDILSEDLQSLESYRYNPLENSTVSMYRGGNDYINFTKVGNTIHVNGTHNMGNNLWFEDNNGILITMGPIGELADRCNHNNTWYPITNVSACGGSTEEVIYEINLVREPINVCYGIPWSYHRVESFP